MDAKLSTKTKTKIVLVQNLFKYISFFVIQNMHMQDRKRFMEWKEILKIIRSATNQLESVLIGMTTKSKENVKMYTKYSKSVKR